MKDWMIDALLVTEDKAKRQDKCKANRKKKLIIEDIKCWIACGNIKKAVDLAEKNNISPKEFGKITKEVC